MDPATEFRRNAEECRRMARTTFDRADRQTWNTLAERWTRCAEFAERQMRAAQLMAQARAGSPRRDGRIAGRPQQAA